MRAEHLQDAISTPTGDEGGRISLALAEIATNLARGIAPEMVGPWLAGACLIPLRKKDDIGVRPIAVGEVIRRLVSKVCCNCIKEKAASFFLDIGQVGVGTKGGAEAAVQAVRISSGKGDQAEHLSGTATHTSDAPNPASQDGAQDRP